MISYTVDIAGRSATVTLDASNQESSGTLSYSGAAADRLQQWLSSAYGAFGHIIGESATPTDLAAAMDKAPAYIDVIRISGPIPKQWSPNLPKNALT